MSSTSSLSGKVLKRAQSERGGLSANCTKEGRCTSEAIWQIFLSPLRRELLFNLHVPSRWRIEFLNKNRAPLRTPANYVALFPSGNVILFRPRHSPIQQKLIDMQPLMEFGAAVRRRLELLQVEISASCAEATEKRRQLGTPLH